ncbi:MAG TPA: glycosyl hydrolase family 28 protein [Chitinophagaceae bacterium]|nr:glycosyl hydrolase family 28 protein [Chitinophagaceae bacterium]
MKRLSPFRKYVIVLLLAAGHCLQAVAQQYNIKDFGAIAGGTTDNTPYIQKAIDSCARTGGKVIIPSGTFLTATLYLKSNVTLSLDGGAILLGSPDINKYPYLDAGIRFYGDQWARQSLLFCKNAVNVSIEGLGTIDGQGASFPITTDKKPDRYKNRPYLLWFAGCKNISIKNVQLRNSAFWMQHYLACEYLQVDGIKIWNHSNKNNDMMDIDGCKYVTVSNVTGDSDDDGITIKSTSPSLSENITITNCILSSHCNALKFGTESTGGFRNITISNCVIKPSLQLTTIYGKPAGNSGLSMELVDGGIMENVSVSNLVIEGPQVPLFVRLGNRARKFTTEAPGPPVGRMNNIRISNIIARGGDETGCSFTGLANAPIENIFLNDIYIESNGGGRGSDTLRSVDEMETVYPEATMFGPLPSYGFYIRHAKGVTLSNITLTYKGTDTRPGMAVVDAERFSFSGLHIQSEGKTEKTVYEKVTFDNPAEPATKKSGKRK